MKQDSGFFKQVYHLVRQIPAGRVASYGQLALCLGRPRAARFVGFAMRGAPEGVPSHRVVRKSGELPPDVVFGAGVQRALLEGEGVTFLQNGYVDMKKHAWHGVG